MKQNEKEKWMKEYKAFYEKHLDCPQAREIDSLTLVMKKEYAEAIKRGEKTVEFRNYSKFYGTRLFDKDVDAYIDQHQGEPEIAEALAKGIITPMRIVKSLHFHNYNNTWEMDVECIANGVIAICEEDIRFLQEKFNCHELDEELERFKGVDEPPLLFYFACGKIENTKNI